MQLRGANLIGVVDTIGVSPEHGFTGALLQQSHVKSELQ
jgi:hypothetical protein